MLGYEKLSELGMSEEDLGTQAKGAAGKCAIAWLVRTRTTAGDLWTTRRLKMGHPSNMTVYVKRISDAGDRDLLRLRKRIANAACRAS